MKLFCLFSTILMLSGLAGAPLGAQETWPLGLVYEYEPEEAATVLWEVAYCIADRRGDEIDDELRAAGDPSETASLQRRLIDTNRSCILRSAGPGAQLELRPRRFRGNLAEARYVALYPDPRHFDDTASEPARISAEEFNARIEAARAVEEEVIEIFAECVVETRPAQVDALLRTQFRSTREMDLLGRLSASFGGCLWEGQTIEFGREDLRAVLADAMYRDALSAGSPLRITEATE